MAEPQDTNTTVDPATRPTILDTVGEPMDCQLAWHQIGQRNRMILGARTPEFHDEEGWLQFRVGENSFRWWVVVKYRNDLYDIELGQKNRAAGTWLVLNQAHGIYNDMLGEVIHRMVEEQEYPS